MRDTIKLTKAALDDNEAGDIVLRGVIDADSMKFLKVAEYQREILPKSQINSLMEALKTSSVPDIDLGMRGGGFVERDEAFYLQDDVYIIDGLQRVTAGTELMRQENIIPHLGAIVHFNTDDKLERIRFRMLNTSRVRLSPNILLRNYRADYTVMEVLYNLCFDKSFVLYDRVSWSQRMVRHHLISAAIFTKVAGVLHGGFGPSTAGDMITRMGGFQKTMNNVGRNTMRDNMKTYFNLIDECWHLRQIVFKESAPFLKGTFLATLAKLLASHQNFWDDTRLVLSADQRRKFAMFPVNDPQVSQLSAVSGKARDLLYQLMVNHFNSGKRTNRLVPLKRNLTTAGATAGVAHIAHVQ